MCGGWVGGGFGETRDNTVGGGVIIVYARMASGGVLVRGAIGVGDSERRTRAESFVGGVT